MSNVDEVLSLVSKESKQDGVDFSEYDLKGVSLNGVSFIYATLNKTNIDNSELIGINFSQGSLKDSTIKSSKIKDTDFTGADLTGVDFEETIFVNCNFKNATTENCEITGAKQHPARQTTSSCATFARRTQTSVPWIFL